jgi:hypothetical protein
VVPGCDNCGGSGLFDHKDTKKNTKLGFRISGHFAVHDLGNVRAKTFLFLWWAVIGQVSAHVAVASGWIAAR